MRQETRIPHLTNDRWRQPRLRVDSDEEGLRHASWIELFFDLVFVVAIAELSHTLETHLSLIGFLQFAALFVPCWWAWTLFTFYADRYDTDDVVHRLLILSGMLAIIFLAANVHNAFNNGAIGFTLAYVATRSIVLMLYIRVVQYVSVARANLNLYLRSYIPSTILWLASIAFGEPTRYILWAIAMTIELLTPILGSRLLTGTPVHPSHLPERFGLLTLIVLGEEIVSVASTTAGGNWDLLPTIAAVFGFAIAACLWWLYFNFLETAVIIRGIRSVHVYNYGHLPIVMGLALVAVGTEHTIHEASHHVLSFGARWALCGGVALYMLSISIISVTACRRNFSWLMVASVAIALTLAIFGGLLPALTLQGLLLAMLVIKVSIEILKTKFTATREDEIIKMETRD
ncbi:low temperature requirement protein A [Hassallia byssoidea VB512170]|uniref:Low temperature requirement protein A n=1 Tax=Hassallia byssoidea VB512170 TaxID=1304833 RepID=A0A846H0I6_9CYAN|nr:low temperature requirement protein A [Hassalia byssoidea]NEU71075.1 low temperature requirement protein A [Hassalia byssoidea VB512170]